MLEGFLVWKWHFSSTYIDHQKTHIVTGYKFFDFTFEHRNIV